MVLYVGEIKDVMFSTSEKGKSEALASDLDHQPKLLTTQLGERLSNAMEQQIDRITASVASWVIRARKFNMAAMCHV